MKICSQCGRQSDDSLNFCTECGAALPQSESHQQEYQQTGYQQSEYRQSNYQQPQTPPPGGNGRAVAALVLGIIGIVSFWTPWFNIVSLTISIIGIVLGMKARNEIPVGYQGRGIATAGLICSIIGTFLSGIGFLTCTLCVSYLTCFPYDSYIY